MQRVVQPDGRRVVQPDGARTVQPDGRLVAVKAFGPVNAHSLIRTLREGPRR